MSHAPRQYTHFTSPQPRVDSVTPTVASIVRMPQVSNMLVSEVSGEIQYRAYLDAAYIDEDGDHSITETCLSTLAKILEPMKDLRCYVIEYQVWEGRFRRGALGDFDNFDDAIDLAARFPSAHIRAVKSFPS